MRFIGYCCLCWLAFACTEDGKGDDSNAVLLSPAQSTYTAACQRDTLQFEAEGAWSVAADSPWVTLELAEGKGDGAVPLYIQQNDGEQAREARVTVRLAGGDTLAVRLTQYDSDENSMGTLVDLPRTFGLGWGYDLTEDYADPDGLRGQVFDAALLRQYGGERVLATSTETSVKTETLSEHTAQDLTSSLKAKVGGGLDIGIASAKVEMEYAKQMAEHKDRLYIWYRDKRIVKNAWIARVPTDNMVRQCVTADFRQAVATLPARDIVRKYGTHWVSRAWLGGRMDYYFTVSQSVKASAESIALTVTVKFLCWSASASTSVSEKTWSEIQQDFEGNFEVSGGGTAGDVLNKALADAMKKGQPLTEGEALIGAWIDRFGADAKDEDLTMVDFEVKPIHELVGALDAKKGEEVKRYIENEYKK